VKQSGFKRWLAKQGATFADGGKHLKVSLSGKRAHFPSHPSAELKTGLVEDVLVSAMDFFFEDERRVPPPSKARKGEVMIELPPSVCAKVLLLNTMLASGVSRAELARRMGTSQREVQRIIKIRHTTKIDTLGQALHALGKRLEVKLA
jgi:antitoxin HicB